MAAAETTTEGTQASSGGFPPFKTETFPAQLFWLTVTFAFLFVVLWRVAGPRIGGVIAERKGRIESDLGAAEKHRKDAEAALTAYNTALAQARSRAQAVAEDNRKRIAAEVQNAKTLAETESRQAASVAEARIAATRTEARGHIEKTAQEAAIDIVSRLTGDAVSASEAATAVKSVSGS